MHMVSRESKGDYSNTFNSSRTLKDASQRSTATHTIPKVTGEVRSSAHVCLAGTGSRIQTTGLLQSRGASLLRSVHSDRLGPSSA